MYDRIWFTAAHRLFPGRLLHCSVREKIDSETTTGPSYTQATSLLLRRVPTHRIHLLQITAVACFPPLALAFSASPEWHHNTKITYLLLPFVESIIHYPTCWLRLRSRPTTAHEEEEDDEEETKTPAHLETALIACSIHQQPLTVKRHKSNRSYRTLR